MPDWTSLLQQPNQIKPLTLQDVYDPNAQLRNTLAVASLLDQRENAVRRNRLLDMAIKQKQDEETANKLNLIGTQGVPPMGGNMLNQTPAATPQTAGVPPATQPQPKGPTLFPQGLNLNQLPTNLMPSNGRMNNLPNMGGIPTVTPSAPTQATTPGNGATNPVPPLSRTVTSPRIPGQAGPTPLGTAGPQDARPAAIGPSTADARQPRNALSATRQPPQGSISPGGGATTFPQRGTPEWYRLIGQVKGERAAQAMAQQRLEGLLGTIHKYGQAGSQVLAQLWPQITALYPEGRNLDPSQLSVEGQTIAVHLPNGQTVKFLKDDKVQGKSGESSSSASGSWEELKKKKGW